MTCEYINDIETDNSLVVKRCKISRKRRYTTRSVDGGFTCMLVLVQ